MDLIPAFEAPTSLGVAVVCKDDDLSSVPALVRLFSIALNNNLCGLVDLFQQGVPFCFVARPFKEGKRVPYGNQRTPAPQQGLVYRISPPEAFPGCIEGSW